MRLDFDLNVGALYISLSEHEVVQTQLIDDNTTLDLDADGVIVGIEVIAIGYPWPVEDVLGGFRLPPGQAEQIRTYFRPSMPDAVAGTPVTRYEAPAILVAA
jgi:uncharacterized protein YuzE